MISLRSTIARKVLEHFFFNPGARHYVQELARILKTDPKNLYRKLRELEKEGMLASDFSGKQRYFSLNNNYPLLREYRRIVFRTLFEKRLGSALEGVEGVQEAYLFGSYAAQKMNAASDVDLLVVGNHSSLALQRVIQSFQKEIGREINAVSMGPKEFLAKRKRKDPFLKQVLSGKRIKLL
ncbi:MAG: nucleotidyltransferase domain-containing protein [Patescibacteria group bacterium]